jgi:ubiquinone/menaquinone biosynthesis C-methylase UbiE
MKDEDVDETNEKVYADKELEVARANLRAWNNWGRLWYHDKVSAKALSDSTLRLMKVRALTYQQVYLCMITFIGELKDKSVLDVGCGTSDYLRWLSSDCNRLIGVDLSVEMLKVCRADIGESIELIAADALHLPFRDNAFDVSTTFQALHHFPNWKKALKEMVRTAKKVGLYEPNRDSFLHRSLNSIRQISRVEARFKEIDEEYRLVEFQAGGFSSAEISSYLKQHEVTTKKLMFGMFPVSLLDKFYWFSPRLLCIMFIAEDLMRRIPILRNQLGGMLVIGWRKINHNSLPLANSSSAR